MTAVLAPLSLLVLRRRAVLDHPNARSSHSEPTPRGVGIALALAGVVAVSASDLANATTYALIVGAGGLALLGLWEDLRGVPPATRFAVQAVLAAATMPWLLDNMSGRPAWKLFVAAASVVWIVAFANAFNFMDGINGISAAETAVAGASFAIIGDAVGLHVLTVGGLIIVAVVAGFVPLNYPRAIAFIGDAGSYFLGGWIAIITVIALRAQVPIEAAFGATVIYLADTGTTLLRRMRSRERWWTPHRNHTYQRLTIAGWSHETTTAFVAGASLICALLGTLTIEASGSARVAIDIAIAAVTVAYLSSPRFAKSRRAYR
jgi:UDP-N-acetylmuramyl pentapeptide phosphotransferase/UDP-N-acetylglucosamine-1-phosphate transferase